MMEETGEENDKVKIGFAKHLASCNKKTRDTAVELLRRWLEAQTHVSDLDFKKIWKGLFYCVWHADKHEVQAQLIDKLASLIRTLDLALARHYFQVFLLTMVREWSGIDHLRLDKFYLMLSRFLHHVFLLLDDHGWGSELTKGFMADLRDGTLLTQDKYPAKSVNLHFVDVYLNELADFLPLGIETFGLLFEPLYSVLAKSPDKLLVSRVRHNVFDCLLESGKKLIKRRQEQRQGHDVVVDGDDKVEKFGSIAVTMGIANGLFELATADSTLQANRKVIYALYEDFGKLEKYFSASGISIFPNGVKKRKLSAEKEPLVAVDDANQQVDDKMEIFEEGRGDNLGKKIKEVEKLEINEEGSLDKLGKRIKEAKKSKLEKVREKGKSKKAKNPAASEDETSAIKKKAKKLASSEDGTSAIKKKTKKLSSSEDGTSATKKAAKKIASKEDGTSAIRSKLKGSSELRKRKSCVKEKKSAMGEAMIDHVGNTDDGANNDQSVPSLDSNFQDFMGFGDSVISNLQKEFEKVAAELGDGIDQYGSPVMSLAAPISPLDIGSKKRKRVKNVENKVSRSPSLSTGPSTFSSCGKSGEKSVKKVRFSMKSNLVWKPHSPLPPESLRVPPSATPRGSALKKGVPPGPIRIMKESPSPKRIRRKSLSARKSQKILKSSSPNTKLMIRKRRSNVL